MKKLMTSAIILLPLLVLAILLVSGAIMSLVTHIYVDSVEIVGNGALVLVMEDEEAPPAERLEVNVLPLKAANRGLEFSAEDENIVTVDGEGVVTAKGFGETYVTVASKENRAATAKRKVIVTDDSVHSVTLKPYEHDLYLGDEPFRLSAEVLPDGATDKRVKWESSAPSVLSVSQTGEVKVLGKGTASVTVSSLENPEIKATAEFECHIPLNSVSADTTPVETAQKSASFPEILPAPADATYSLTYTSSDKSVATVGENGEITFLKAGRVTVKAEAEDGRGHRDSVSVRYDCTFGYYMGQLFGQGEYAFDYDTFRGQTLEALRFQAFPDGSDREIVSVETDRDDLLEYDASSESFRLKEAGESAPLGTAKITVRARKYDKKSGKIELFDTDVCTVKIERGTQKLSFVGGDAEISSFSFTSNSFNLFAVKSLHAEGGIGVLASPVNHTDTFSYSVEGAAELKGTNVRFLHEGEAVITVTAESGASARLTVTYTAPSATSKTVELSEEAPEKSLSLDYRGEGQSDEGILKLSAPDGYTVQIRSDNDDIVEVDGYKLVAVKGGFAEVTVSFVRASAAAFAADLPSYTVHVYVDELIGADGISLSAGDIPVEQGGTFFTAKNSTTLSVSVEGRESAMAGKEIFINEQSLGEGRLSCEKEFTFRGAGSISVTVAVKYISRATECDNEKSGAQTTADCTLRSSDGKIESGLEVTLGGAAYGEDNRTLSFSDIGDTAELAIAAPSPSPFDFVLEEKDILFHANDLFDTHIDISENSAAVVLTSKNGTYSESEGATLTVAGKTFSFGVKSEALADTLKAEYKDTSLVSGNTYFTFLSILDITVTPSRADGKELTEAGKAVNYTFGEEGGAAHRADIHGKTFSFSLSPAEEEELSVESGTARFTLRLKKCELSELGFEFKLKYNDNGGEVPLGPFSFEEGRVEAVFPKDMQGSFDICITPSDNASSFLGGLDAEKARAYFTVDEKADWTIDFRTDRLTVTFTVTPPESLRSFAAETVALHGNGQTVVIAFSRVDVQSIEFLGFDSGDDSNGGDVYKGYQQVRVFAKHSDYGDGKGTVDYFRMPFKALSNLVRETPADLTALAWTITLHSDRDGASDTVLVSQIGNVITYKADEKNTEYTVVPVEGGPSVLKQGEKIIAQNGKYEDDAAENERIPWIDVFAEPASDGAQSCAYIYFGNVGGLSEVDVQNDYFGNFGEKAEWTKAEQTVSDAAKEGSGRRFTPSENAYTYLRIEAGDGAGQSKANAHFNFNVLQDAALVNVFNATGYYANNKIVLHEDLYGAGENPEAPEEQFLNETSNLDKNTIYGNGYQVNFEAMNASLVKKGDKGTSNGVGVQIAYNAKIKGSTPTETLKKYEHVVVLKMQYAYYCDVEYYSKISPWGASGNTPGYIYLKNTVLRCAAQSALQLYYSTSTAYIENVVLNECVGGFVSDSQDGRYDVVYNFKGFVDVLNYMSFSGLASSINQTVGMLASLEFDTEIINSEQYLEWFGKTPSAIAPIKSESDPWLTGRFFNVFLYNRYKTDQGSTVTIKYWDDATQQYQTKEEGGPFDNGVGLATPIDKEAVMMVFIKMGYYRVFVYDTSVALDGGQKTGDSQYYNSRNMNELFSENRYIRLLCQYKSLGSDGKTPEKNFEHILWHTNAIYRDYSIIGRREGHIDNLKESLKGTEWLDGSGVGADGIPYEAAQMTALLSETVVPAKRAY